MDSGMLRSAMGSLSKALAAGLDKLAHPMSPAFPQFH